VVGCCLFCKKTTLSRIILSRKGINNEEALEEDGGAGWGCLFLRCSSKQTTSRGGFEPPSAVLTIAQHPVGTRVVEDIPEWSNEKRICSSLFWQNIRLQSSQCSFGAHCTRKESSPQGIRSAKITN
jgi:hypothetical protein